MKDFMRFGDMNTETPGCDGGAAICRDMYRGISPPSPTDSHGSVTRGAAQCAHVRALQSGDALGGENVLDVQWFVCKKVPV